MDGEHKSEHLPSKQHWSPRCQASACTLMVSTSRAWGAAADLLTGPCNNSQPPQSPISLLQTKHLVWLQQAKWAFLFWFLFCSKYKYHVRNKEIKVKREARLSFSPDHIKAGVFTVSTAFILPGECLPGANFNVLSGAMFSLFNCRSHRNYKPQMQPYLHPDICSQRDLSSSLWSDQENTGDIITTLTEFLHRHALLYTEVADKLS